MKKAFLIAFAALCAFAAQAVTVNWTSHGSVTNGQSISISNSVKSFSVALVFDLGDVASASNMNAFFSVLSDTLCYSFGADGSTGGNTPRMGMNYSGNLPTSSNASWKTNTNAATIIENGKNTIGLIFYVTDTGDQYIDCYVNGTIFNPGSKWTGSGNKPYKNVTLDEIVIGTETSMSNVQLYTTNGKATAEDFASVPEPTALALLALGVAGLALKRKVA